jgi:CheY-like chemotaxis protein
MMTALRPGPEGHDLDVLIVDDEAEAAEELVEYLSKAGLRCRPALDAWAALRLLAEGYRSDVVVTDIRMPELTGMEFAERLGRLGDKERPEIIFVSGHAGFEDAVEALRLGARDLLTKPIDGKRLVQAVKSAKIARQARHAGAADPIEKGADRPQNGLARKKAALADLRAVRRLRSKYFSSDLFADPCWEMLLDLYDASLGQAEVTVTSLGAASGVPLTTALRRMEALQSHNLIIRIEDRDDKRRTIMKLTDAGLQAVEGFFDTYLGRRMS